MNQKEAVIRLSGSGHFSQADFGNVVTIFIS